MERKIKTKEKKPVIAAMVCFLLILQMSIPMAAGACENFAHRKVYQQGQYTDVTSDMWFYNNVKTAFEAGLMNGNSPNTFNPRGNITYAEVVTIAARLHSIYTTNREFTYNEKPWYRGYADYAIKNGMISRDYSDYSAPATRAEFAAIMSRAFPLDEYVTINQISGIPDVPTWESYYDNVIRLYRAGILTGNDTSGTFAPNSYIERSAVAAIVSRMADRELRVTFTLSATPGSGTVTEPIEPIKPEEPVRPVERSIEVSPKEGELFVGDSLKLSAAVYPDDGQETVQWISSDQDVAIVDNGFVRGIAAGTAVITAMYGSAADRCVLTVRPDEIDPSPQVIYYSRHPDVPDFGAVTGAQLVMERTPSSGNGRAYLYNVRQLDENKLQQYVGLLRDDGFRYVGSFEGSNGPVMIYKRMNISVMLGVMSGLYSIVISYD